MIKKILILCFLLVAITSKACAQTQQYSVQGQMLPQGTAFFVPHWYVRAQVGAAVDVGEAEFAQLLSPAAVQTGYKYPP